MSCVFCGLLAGDGPAVWVARYQATAAFLPLPEGSLAPGHTLVVPTEHVVGVQDASPRCLAETIGLVQRVSVALRAALGATGVNVLNASGPGSEQSVPHLHFHVVPRWADDGFSTWPQGRSSKQLVEPPAAELARALAAQPAPDALGPPFSDRRC